jgi:hypothetical protein
MKNFDIFESFKKDVEYSLIAEVKVNNGKPVFVCDKLNLFEESFFSENGNGWLRINFPYNQSAENIKIKKVQAIFLARTFPASSAFYAVEFNNRWFYWTHPIIRELGDDFSVKFYG